jgi:hypothetical protein
VNNPLVVKENDEHAHDFALRLFRSIRSVLNRAVADLVSGAHLGPVTNFSFALKFLLDSYGFVIL